jgi:hypothetical protein
MRLQHATKVSLIGTKSKSSSPTHTRCQGADIQLTDNTVVEHDAGYGNTPAFPWALEPPESRGGQRQNGTQRAVAWAKVGLEFRCTLKNAVIQCRILGSPFA